jgi:hypothetical protein
MDPQNPNQNPYSGYPQDPYNQPQAGPSYGYTQNPPGYPQPPQNNFPQGGGFQTPSKPQKPKFDIKAWLKKRWWVALIGGILVLGLILAGVVVITRPETVQRPNLTRVYTQINAPTELPQGKIGEWEVVIENQESVPIRDIQVELKFDSDFEYLREITPSPDNIEGTKYSIAQLDEVGGRSPSVKIRFSGKLIGNPDIETIMEGSISYIPVAQNAAVTSLDIPQARTRITSPQLDVRLTPTEEEVSSGGEAEFTVVARNLSDEDLIDLRLRMVYPSGLEAFTYTSSELSESDQGAPQTTPDEGTDIWEISRLPAGAETTLRVRGRVFGANNTRVTFGVEMAILDTNNQYQLLTERYKDVNIVAQALTLTTEFVGKDNLQIFRPGETLQVKLRYENQTQNTLSNVQIESSIDDPASILDYSELSFGGGQRGDVLGNVIQWRATRLPQLQTVRPGQTGEISYSLKVKELENFLNVNLNQTTYTLRPTVEMRADGVEQIQVAGTLYKAKGSLELTIDPPVEKSTTATGDKIYTITWKLNTWQNQVTDVSLSASSPLPGDFWTGRIDPPSQSGNLSYDINDGSITWSVGLLESYTGNGNNPLTVSFDVLIPNGTPDNDIITDIRYDGVDIVTGEKYEAVAENIDID